MADFEWNLSTAERRIAEAAFAASQDNQSGEGALSRAMNAACAVNALRDEDARCTLAEAAFMLEELRRPGAEEGVIAQRVRSLIAKWREDVRDAYSRDDGSGLISPRSAWIKAVYACASELESALEPKKPDGAT